MRETLRLSIIGLGLLILLILPFVIWGDVIETRLTTLLSDANARTNLLALIFALLVGDVVLPLPSSLLSASAGMIGGAAAGTFTVFVGMTLGHIIGYGLGWRYGARAVVRLAGVKSAQQLEELGLGWGMITMVAMTRAVPVLSEAATLVAGSSAMRFRNFLLACAPPNFAIAIVYGVIGAYAKDIASFLLVFGIAVAVPAAGYALLWITRR